MSIKCIEMKDYKIFLTQKNETWKQALERYKSFLAADMKGYFDKDYDYRFGSNSAYTYRETGVLKKDDIEEFSFQNQINVPSELVQLMCNHGTFKIGEGILEIFNKSIDSFMTLSDVMEEYSYKDIQEQIGPGMLKSMNGFYRFFGVSFPQSDETSFLFFDKSGSFGKMHLFRKNPDMALKKILPSMFNGSIEKFTLDSLISNQIDRVIINALMVRGYID